MKQFIAFASKPRIKALLCCSAAVLLTACGGNIDPGTEQLSATAASVATDAGAAAAAGTTAAAAAVETIAEAAPAASTEAAPVARPEAGATAGTSGTSGTSGAGGQAAEVAAQAFELSGYDSNPLQAQAGQQEAVAHAQAPIRQ